MKVLIYGLNYAPEPVGIGKYSGELGEWLAGRGHQVRVITAPPYFPQWQAVQNRYRKERLAGTLVWRCPLWVPSRPNGLKRLLHLASFAVSSLPVLLKQWDWRPDLIICVAPALFCAPGAIALRKLCGNSTISWLHIQDFELDTAFELGILKGKRIRRLAEIVESRLMRSFQRVSSISDKMLERAIIKGVDVGRTELLPNWVDLKVIYPKKMSERNANPYRKELGLTEDQLVLLYSGSMNKKQGMEIIAEAVRILNKQKDLIWVLAGEGPGKEELKSITRSFEQVRHMPLQPVERLNDWLNLADIHILPQRGEATDLVMPSKVLGILASGLPIVAGAPDKSTLGDIAERAGRRVNPGDAVAFAKAIVELARNAGERMQLGEQGRRLAEQKYGIDTILGKFEHAATFRQSQLCEGD